MDRSDTALIGVSGIVGATVLAALAAANALFGPDASVLRPFVLLAQEPFAWIVVAALVAAVVGNAYIE